MGGGGRLFPLLPGKGLYILEGTPFLYHQPSSSLVAADLHLGYEEAMARLGVFLPRLQLRKALEMLEDAVKAVRPRRVVIGGDIKHVYERLLKQEVNESLRLVGKLLEWGVADIVLVKGNHDTFISGPLKKNGVEVVDVLELGDGILVAHGHKRVDVDYEVLVMGHEHPAVQVDVGGARVKFPAFLLAPLKSSSSLIIVMPATGVYQTGNPVTRSSANYLSPMMQSDVDIDEVKPIISDRSVGVFPLPPLKELLPPV